MLNLYGLIMQKDNIDNKEYKVLSDIREIASKNIAYFLTIVIPLLATIISIITYGLGLYILVGLFIAWTLSFLVFTIIYLIKKNRKIYDENIRISKEASRLIGENKELSSKYKTANLELENKSQQIKLLAKEKKKLEKDKNDISKKYKSLQRKYKQQSIDMKNLSKDLESLTHEYKRLSSDLTEIADKYEEVQETLKTIRNEKAELEKKLGEQKNISKTLGKEFEKVEKSKKKPFITATHYESFHVFGRGNYIALFKNGGNGDALEIDVSIQFTSPYGNSVPKYYHFETLKVGLESYLDLGNLTQYLGYEQIVITLTYRDIYGDEYSRSVNYFSLK